MNEPRPTEPPTIDAPGQSRRSGNGSALPETIDPAPPPPRATVDYQPSSVADTAKTPGPERTAAGADSNPAFTVDDEPAGAGDARCRSVGDYQVLGVLGRGGMGVVYKARQPGLNRVVALKMILAGAHAAPQYLARFQAEAEAVARLRHPNIVQIYEVGKHDGLPYFSLEYVDGGSLAKKIGGKPQPVREAAWTVEALARAMHYAHEHGIVHRDLKPANILLQQDEGWRPDESSPGRSGSAFNLTPFPFVPKISDFGLAKRLEDDASQTRTGTIVGTPTYMAPEQAWGQVHDVGPLADVYALGVILYELLTGRPPFQGATTLDTLEQVRAQEPVPPTRLQPKVPRDLETVCLKCLQKDPKKRYASAVELADDLHRFLAGEPILARPVSAPERLWRWCLRNPRVALLSASTAGLLVLFVVGLGVALLVVTQERNAKDRESVLANLAKDAALEARNEADQNARVAGEQGRLALTTLSNVVNVFQQELKGKPALQPLRLKLLAMAETDMERVLRNADESKFDRTMAGILQRRGDNLIELNRINDALTQFRRCHAIVERLEQASPEDPQTKKNLAIACEKLGDVTTRLGDVKSALDYYGRTLALRQEWSRLAPQDADARSQVARSYHLLGALNLRLGNLAEARNDYLNSQQWQDKLPEAVQKSPQARRSRAGLYDKLGEISFRLGEGEVARGYFLRALEIRKAVAAAEPADNIGVQRDVFISHKQLGDVSLLVLKDAAAARASYAEAVAVSRKLLALDPNLALSRADLADGCYRLATACWRAGDRTAAEGFYQECLQLREKLAAPDANVLNLQADLMLALARCGRHAEAARIAGRVRDRAADNPLLLYMAGTGYALCALAVAESPGSLPAGDVAALQQLYQEAALDTLRQALARGWKDPVLLDVDPDLDAVRAHPGFKALAASMHQPEAAVAPPTARR